MTSESPGGPTSVNGHAAVHPVLSSNRTNGHARNGAGGGHRDDEAVIGISPFVSVPTLLAALRRRSRVLMALALIGVVAGLAVGVGLPPPYTATSTVLLQHPAGSDPQREMPTDLQLLRTRAVAQAAADRGHLPISAKNLLAKYDGIIISDRVLTITASATSAADAVARGRAVADAYLAFRQQQLQLQLQATVAAIKDRENTLTTEQSALDEQINAYSLAPQKDPAAVRAFGDVLTHRQEVASEIASLQSQIDTDTTDADNVIAGSRVIDPAAPDNRSAKKKTAEYALVGLIFGLVAGIAGILIIEVMSEGARKREDVANALGVPVAVSIASLPTPRRGRVDPAAAATGPGLGPVVRHLQRQLDTSPATLPGLLVVALGDERPAAIAVAALAADLRRAGRRVCIADYSRRGLLQALAAPGAITVIPLVADAAARVESTPPGGSNRAGDADAVLTLATLDPEIGAFHLRAWATTAVAVVTAGRATPTALHSASRMLRAAGIDLVSAVLVGADRSDETLGVPVAGRIWTAEAPAAPVHGTPSPAGAAPTPRTGP